MTKQITIALRHRILNGQLARGAVLRPERLANERGVSRIPLREAIRHLEPESQVVCCGCSGPVESRRSNDRVRDMCLPRVYCTVA